MWIECGIAGSGDRLERGYDESLLPPESAPAASLTLLAEGPPEQRLRVAQMMLEIEASVELRSIEVPAYSLIPPQELSEVPLARLSLHRGGLHP